MEFLHGKQLHHKGNELVHAEVALKKKLLLLFYFTTNDSEACRVFDEKLKDVYQGALMRKIELGVIVVPCDTTRDSYNNNIKTHYTEWYTVQFDDEVISILTYSFDITHVPSLIVVEKNGTIVSREGTKDVESYGVNALVTWMD